MYSTLPLSNRSKTGTLVGTHQKFDRTARGILGRHLPRRAYFPTAKEIVYFEGMRGPDGLKRKSPGVDEPSHFILPDNDDRQLITMILDHQYNLRQALRSRNDVRAAFEAAWLAHAITDGLTPAHHFPYHEAVDELMTEQEFIKVFGQPIKGIMRGHNALEAARNNWLYWGAGGYMSKHVAFEYGVAVLIASLPVKSFSPKLTRKNLCNVDLKTEFYAALERINRLKMYDRFRRDGWTSDLAFETKNTLAPEIIRLIALAWASCIPEFNK